MPHLLTHYCRNVTLNYPNVLESLCNVKSQFLIKVLMYQNGLDPSSLLSISSLSSNIIARSYKNAVSYYLHTWSTAKISTASLLFLFLFRTMMQSQCSPIIFIVSALTNSIMVPASGSFTEQFVFST